MVTLFWGMGSTVNTNFGGTAESARHFVKVGAKKSIMYTDPKTRLNQIKHT